MNGIKKRRGLKGYYKKLTTENDLDKATWLEFDNPKTWFDNWHMHFDRECFGNNSFKRRKPHLDKLFRHFDLLVNKTENLKVEFQLYTVLLDFKSQSDALFLHTPNPNNSQFPFRVSNLKKTTSLKNKQLNEYIENLNGYEKLYGKAEEAFCLLYRKSVGNPFE